jgi:hypothetical protein
VICPGLPDSERALARRLYPKLEEDRLLIADRGFYDWQDWRKAADTGAALLWRFKSDIRLPSLSILLHRPRRTGHRHVRAAAAAGRIAHRPRRRHRRLGRDPLRTSDLPDGPHCPFASCGKTISTRQRAVPTAISWDSRTGPGVQHGNTTADRV